MLLSLFRFLLGERPAEPRRDDRRDCLPDDKVLNDPRGHGRLLLCSLVLGTVDRPHRCVLLVIGTPMFRMRFEKRYRKLMDPLLAH